MRIQARILTTVAAAFCLTWAIDVNAQRPRPQPIESPVVHPDRTVTFNFRAPNAKKVELSAQFLRGNQALQADTNGMWSITVGPVEPNLYPYNFVVDGVSVADPNNLQIFPNERFKSSLDECQALSHRNLAIVFQVTNLKPEPQSYEHS